MSIQHTPTKVTKTDSGEILTYSANVPQGCTLLVDSVTNEIEVVPTQTQSPERIADCPFCHSLNIGLTKKGIPPNEQATNTNKCGDCGALWIPPANYFATAMQPAPSERDEAVWQPMATAPRVVGGPLSDECIPIIARYDLNNGDYQEVTVWWTGVEEYPWCAAANAYPESRLVGWKFKAKFLQDYSDRHRRNAPATADAEALRGALEKVRDVCLGIPEDNNLVAIIDKAFATRAAVLESKPE